MKVTHLAAISVLLFTSTPSLVTASGNNFTRRCGRLIQTFKNANTTVLLSTYVTKGTNVTYPDSDPTCQSSVIAMADVCRLRLNVTTSSSSNVIMEVWMPTNWADTNKRFAMTSDGGVSGCIDLDDLTFTTTLGFSTVGHNNGHDGTDSLAFLNKPEVIKDFSYRAVQVATKVGKTATNFFYQDTLNKSYYWGCSGAGRSGMKAAQSFPEEFDGIIAGDPASEFHRVVAGGLSYWYHMGNTTAPTWLNFDQWTAINAEVLAQCDTLDGVKDNVLEDPFQCKPRFDAMLCSDGETWAKDKCLTAVQVAAVEKIYSPVYGDKGRFIFPAVQPGNDQVFGFYLVYGSPDEIATHYLKYGFYNDANWQLPSTLDGFLPVMDDLLDRDPYGVSANNPDLSKLRSLGHKLLVYHGGSDGFYTPQNTIDQYENVSKNMTLRSSQLDEFFRFFMIPGMNHCTGGNGAWYMGGPGQVGMGVTGVNANDSLIMQMVKWVEEGKAPETIRGYAIGASGGAEGAVRDHCKWPAKNHYKGGNANDASSWECKLNSLYN
ncbi:Tannase and feruloyl esterase [Orbilia ellipsospora]|uniref:Carboxylic ester hydrolase n=1 Tax=Orbilia ellipsospora TaxID=2528407 RepID=A0AAV9X858_9PEZI